MANTEEKIVKAAQDAKDKLISLGIEEQLVSELEWCLGSYAHDQNPDGLYMKTQEALDVFTEYKKSNPRKISKKLVDDLSKALKK